MEGHFGLPCQIAEHFGERPVVVRGIHGAGELLFDQLLGGGERPPLGLEPRPPRIGEFGPVFRVGEGERPHEGGAGPLGVFGVVEEARRLVVVDRPLGREPANDAALGEKLLDDRVVGGELSGLLGDHFGLGIPLLVHEGVVFLHQHRQPLIHVHPLGPLAIDLGGDLLIASIEGEFGGPFAGGLLDVAAGAIDPPLELALRLFGNAGGVDRGGQLLEDREGVRGLALGEPAGLELLGGHLGRQLGEFHIRGGRGCRHGRSLVGRCIAFSTRCLGRRAGPLHDVSRGGRVVVPSRGLVVGPQEASREE